jgi:hypothetical protein
VVALTVDDDGPGLAPSMRNQVMRRGVRADEGAPGSGLGLAIVGELMQLYGGTIALEDSPLGGLRARLRLPSWWEARRRGLRQLFLYLKAMSRVELNTMNLWQDVHAGCANGIPSQYGQDSYRELGSDRHCSQIRGFPQEVAHLTANFVADSTEGFALLFRRASDALGVGEVPLAYVAGKWPDRKLFSGGVAHGHYAGEMLFEELGDIFGALIGDVYAYFFHYFDC